MMKKAFHDSGAKGRVCGIGSIFNWCCWCNEQQRKEMNPIKNQENQVHEIQGSHSTTLLAARLRYGYSIGCDDGCYSRGPHSK